MTGSTCFGWTGTAWTTGTPGVSGKGGSSENHAERIALGKQRKGLVLYRFEQTTFPCVERGISSCHGYFLRASDDGPSFHFQVRENVGLYPVPKDHYVLGPAPTEPAADDYAGWTSYKARLATWEDDPFVLVEKEVKAPSGDLYYHRGKAFLNARPHGFPGPA